MSLDTLTVKLARMPEYGMSVAYETITLTIAEKGYSPKPGDGETDINETIEIYLTGAAAVNVQDKVRAINLMMMRASKRKRIGVGDRIYLMVHVAGEVDDVAADVWYGSEILEGRLSIDESELEGPISNGRMNARLAITRKGYFEDGAIRYLPLTNANGNRIQVVNIYNCMDLSGSAPNKLDNHVEIAASDIKGDLPAPVRFTLSLAGTGPVERIYLSKFLNHYGGESAVYPAYHYYDISGSADAAASGGAYKSQTISTNNETAITTVNLDSVFLRLGGDLHHIMARFRSTSSLGNVQFRIVLSSGSTVIWRSRPLRLSNTSQIQDIAVCNMPPTGRGLSISLSLALTGQRLTSNTETIELDFLQFFGREFIKLESVTGVIETSSIIYFGGSNNDRHRLYSGQTMMDLIPYGADSLTLTPGQANGFFFLMQSNNASINYWATVGAEYRPRRSTI